MVVTPNEEELPELPESESTPNEGVTPMAQRMYGVHVTMNFRVPAVDGPDAIQMISRDIGQGRSYKYSLEDTIQIHAMPLPDKVNG